MMLSRISESGTRPITSDCLTTPIWRWTMLVFKSTIRWSVLLSICKIKGWSRRRFQRFREPYSQRPIGP